MLRVSPVLLLALLPLCPAAGLTAASHPHVLILARSIGPGQDGFERLLLDSLRVELEARGISVAQQADPPGAESAITAGERDKALFALEGAYEIDGPRVRLDLGWYDIAARRVAASVSRRVDLDLSFDMTVSDMVAELLAGQGDRIAGLIQAPEGKGEAAAVPAVQPAGPQVRPPLQPLAFSLVAAPFIPVFKASAYISQAGLALLLGGEYRFGLTAGRIGVGAQSGVVLFQAQKASSGSGVIVPVGVTVSYGTVTGSPLDFSVQLGGGPAAFLFTLGGGNTLPGVIAYATGGVGVSLSVMRNLSVSVSIPFSWYFVPDGLMAFSPGASLDLRF